MNVLHIFMFTSKGAEHARTPEMEEPYIESIKRLADNEGFEIGKINRRDYGLCTREVVEDTQIMLEEEVIWHEEMYIVRFWADVIKEPIGEAVGV